MRLALVSDFHLVTSNPACRKDDLIETQKEKLKFVVDTAIDYGANLIFAGDLSDKPRGWYLLPFMAQQFLRMKEEELNIYAVFGQHDTYLYSELTRHATNLGVLERSGLVKVLDSLPCKYFKGDISLYGVSFSKPLGVIPKPTTKGLNILVIHASIAEAPLFHSHEYMDAKTFLEENSKYDLIICGDIHRPFIIEKRGYGKMICNTGPVCRTRAEEYIFQHYPQMYIYDTKQRGITSIITIPHKPAEEVISRDHIREPEEFEISIDLKDFVSSIDNPVNEDDFMEIFMKLVLRQDIEEEVKELLAETMGKEK